MKHLLALLAVAGILSACSSEKGPKNDGPVRLDDPADFNKEFHAEELGSGIGFTAESDWTATVATATKAAASGDAWIDIEPKSGGAGPHTLTVTLAPNLTGKDREASIDIHCLNSKTTFVVRQTGTTSDGKTPGVYFRANNSGEWTTELPEGAQSLAIETRGGAVLTLDTLRRVAALRPASLDMGEAVYESVVFPLDFDPRDPNWTPEQEGVDLSSLSAVVLPPNVRKLGTHALAGSGIESIELFNVDSIGRGAFLNCKQLKTVAMSAFLRSIGESAFEGAGLQEFTLPGSVLSVGAYAFRNSSLVTLSVEMAADTLCIGTMAFYECQYLRNIELLNRETHIQTNAFGKCVDLREVVLNNATVIGAMAFEECALLAKVDLGAAETIGNRAFAVCPALTDVSLNEGLTAIGDGAFKNCERLKAIKLPTSLQKIGQYAFEACDLRSIEFPENVDSLGSGLFLDNFNLSRVTFKTEKLRSIPDRFLIGNREVIMLDLPESVTRIGDAAFFNCGKLNWISMGSRVEYIGESALSSCPNLGAIICRAVAPPVCGDGLVFSSSGTQTGTRNQCHVPAGSVDAYRNHAVWSLLEKYQNFGIRGIAEE